MRIGNTWRVLGERRMKIIQENYSLRNTKNESETKKILRLDHQLTINEEITHATIFPISPFEAEVTCETERPDSVLTRRCISSDGISTGTNAETIGSSLDRLDSTAFCWSRNMTSNHQRLNGEMGKKV